METASPPRLLLGSGLSVAFYSSIGLPLLSGLDVGKDIEELLGKLSQCRRGFELG